MGKLKYTNLRDLQKAKTIERKAFKKKTKSIYRFQKLVQRQRKEREYYIVKIKEVKHDLFIRTRNKTRGKSRKQIKKIWKSYQNKKIEFQADIRVKFDRKTDRYYLPLNQNLTQLEKDIRYLQKKEVRTVMFYVEYEDTNTGKKEFYSKTYPIHNINDLDNFRKFANSFMDTLSLVGYIDTNNIIDSGIILYEISKD